MAFSDISIGGPNPNDPTVPRGVRLVPGDRVRVMGHVIAAHYHYKGEFTVADVRSEAYRDYYQGNAPFDMFQIAESCEYADKDPISGVCVYCHGRWWIMNDDFELLPRPEPLTHEELERAVELPARIDPDNLPGIRK